MARPVNTPYTPESEVMDKLLSFVEIPKTGGCVLWTGPVNHNGYGRIGYASKRELAHRVSYELFKLKGKKIPRGLGVCHTCDNPRCVNPKHLFLGDQKVNMVDAKSKGRTTQGERAAFAKLTNKDIKKIFKLRSAGLTHREIGERYEVAGAHIGHILSGKRWGHLARPDAPLNAEAIDRERRKRVSVKGSAHGRSKLKEADVLTIKAMLNLGIEQQVIAAKYNVSKATICVIAQGKRWAHLGG